MDPVVAHELAYVLLIELLSYQFCSPVRWIETQDVILAEKKTERIIEVGPSNTLISMAQKTLAYKYEASDIANAFQRHLLCSKSNSDEIYYVRLPPEHDHPDPPSSSSRSNDPVADLKLGQPEPREAHSRVISNPTINPASLIPDVAVTAREVVKALVAIAIKKPPETIVLSNSIKFLSAGRSTLQNEIISDLSKEFGSIPEGAEEMPLDELSAVLQGNFRDQLGVKSKYLIERMTSTKMHGSFNLLTTRDYLKKRWFLGSGRQDGVLLAAVMKQPPSRMNSEKEAKDFLDLVTEGYFSANELSLPNLSVGPHEEFQSEGRQKEILDEAQKFQRNHHQQLLQLHAKELNLDLRAADKQLADLGKIADDLRSELDFWNSEHGDFYSAGIRPKFDSLKVRRYDSAWNWALQDVFVLFHGIMNNSIHVDDCETRDLTIRIINRAEPRVSESIDFFRRLIDLKHIPDNVLAFVEVLLTSVHLCMTLAPVFRKVPLPTAPRTVIDPSGTIRCIEVARPKTIVLQHQIDDDARDIHCNGDSAKVVGHHNQEKEKCYVKATMNGTLGSSTGDAHAPEIHVRTESGWVRSDDMSSQYLDTLHQIGVDGLSFHDRNVLVTGAGEGSLGAKVIEDLLEAGARIMVTTSSYNQETIQRYQKLYTKYGASGSCLIVAPFNQGSLNDVLRLVSYIYDPCDGLGWDLDHIIPFAAVSENGHEIDELGSKSEFAHRLMLTNTLRLLGAVKNAKCIRGVTGRPAQVILPLSPNHGLLGNDGLYSESKLGLEGMFGKWHSESWSNYLSICGAVIGWTRGTNLMESSDMMAEGIEQTGVRTFSRDEMAFQIMGLMAPSMLSICQSEPIKADLSGGMAMKHGLKQEMLRIRSELTTASEILRAIAEEDRITRRVISGSSDSAFDKAPAVQQQSNIKFAFPKLPDYGSEIDRLGPHLKGMIDLDKVVVVVGFAEVGPYGNARTRWEMEAHGQFSIEGCIEMAWIMNLIKHHNGPKQGEEYCGWVETETGQPINDLDIKLKYEEHILKHSGIRLLDPSESNLLNAGPREFLHEVIVQTDLESFETSSDNAQWFKREHGDKVDIFPISESGQYEVLIKKGARILVPKSERRYPRVAGEVPTGWNPKTYGIEDEIISQVDPVTLFALVCTVEALLSAGITDPFEIYQYIHVSELGNCLGSGVGGIASSSKIFKSRLLDREVQNDILQESFANTAGAWVNMLLLSASGPMKTPVGACATSLESLDAGYELIVAGKAKMCLVGGVDDTIEETSDEFRNMKATVNVQDELDRGRTPREMSRPAATTRNGFVESHGAGIQLLATASLALKMGLPIHGVVALTTTASDKIGRSVPAPGKGLLTTVRETPNTFLPPSLDIKLRKKRLSLRKTHLEEQRDLDLEQLQEVFDSIDVCDQPAALDTMTERCDEIKAEYEREFKNVQHTYGNDFWKDDSRISPLRGALAVWGLTIDDLNVASFHGTSTIMSEKNESDVIHHQLEQLGRQKGNPILGVFQKYLTGHPKGAAGAWMLNGCLQILDTGLVPGNRNLDNVDSSLKQFDHILFPNQSIQTDGVKAFSVTSFGFGQKGAQAIGIHPKYLFATLDEHAYAAYRTKVEARYKKTYRHFYHAMITNTVFAAKESPPYSKQEEVAYLTNPNA